MVSDNQLILLYNMEQHPALPAIRTLCAIKHIRLLAVDPSLQDRPLLSLTLPTLSKTVPFSSDALSSSGKNPFQDPMLVFSGLSPEKVTAFIDILNAQNVPSVALKAVITPTNAKWTSVRLHEELLKEHRFMKGGSHDLP